jgi:hypothetical protein
MKPKDCSQALLGAAGRSRGSNAKREPPARFRRDRLQRLVSPRTCWSRPRGGVLVDLLKLCLILGAAAGLSWFLFYRNARVPDKAFALDAQFDLVSLDAGKEQEAIASAIPFGESLPGSVDYLLEKGRLNDPLRLRNAGKFAVNPLGTDPAFQPTRPIQNPPLPLKLPAEFSELSTKIETNGDAPIVATPPALALPKPELESAPSPEGSERQPESPAAAEPAESAEEASSSAPEPETAASESAKPAEETAATPEAASPAVEPGASSEEPSATTPADSTNVSEALQEARGEETSPSSAEDMASDSLDAASENQSSEGEES